MPPMKANPCDPANRRAFDAGVPLESFNTVVWVRCPRCGAVALSQPLGAAAGQGFAPRRVCCSGCAYTKIWQGRTIVRAQGGDALDDYFHLPLYLQTPCAGDVLWAYNPAHLALQADWLGAALRTRRRDAASGWRNASALSRLPRWLKSAKNRPEVLAALKKLEALAHAL